MHDNFEPDYSFADDIQHAKLDNLRHLVERMDLVVDLDTVANRYFDLVVQALASIGVENLALKLYKH